MYWDLLTNFWRNNWRSILDVERLCYSFPSNFGPYVCCSKIGYERYTSSWVPKVPWVPPCLLETPKKLWNQWGMTDIPENGSGVEPKLSMSGQPKAKGAEVPTAGRRKMVKPKMDFAKALSIMGFSTSRTLDPSGGHDAKVELNAALSRKMADIEKRKRASSKSSSMWKPHKCIFFMLAHIPIIKSLTSEATPSATQF